MINNAGLFHPKVQIKDSEIKVLLSDEEMVNSLVTGKSDGSELYRRYYLPLYRYFYQLQNDAELAKDLVNTLFEKFFRNPSLFDANKGLFRTWIFALARNLWFDELRKRKRMPVQVVPDVELSVIPFDPVERLQQELDLKSLGKALAMFSADERLMLFLRYEMEFSYQEIGKHVGRSSTAVKMQIWRLVRKISKELHHEK